MCDLDILLSTLYIFTYTLRDLVCKTHNGVTGVLQVLWSLNHRSAALSEALIHPILLSGSEIWGQNADNSTTVNVHLCTMKTILNVSSRTRNAMVYGESKCYHQLIFWSYLQTIFSSQLLKRGRCAQSVRFSHIMFRIAETNSGEALVSADRHVHLYTSMTYIRPWPIKSGSHVIARVETRLRLTGWVALFVCYLSIFLCSVFVYSYLEVSCSYTLYLFRLIMFYCCNCLAVCLLSPPLMESRSKSDRQSVCCLLFPTTMNVDATT